MKGLFLGQNYGDILRTFPWSLGVTDLDDRAAVEHSSTAYTGPWFATYTSAYRVVIRVKPKQTLLDIWSLK